MWQHTVNTATKTASESSILNQIHDNWIMLAQDIILDKGVQYRRIHHHRCTAHWASYLPDYFQQRPHSYGLQFFDVTWHCLDWICSFHTSPTTKTEANYSSVTHFTFQGRNKTEYTSKDFDFRKRHTIFLGVFHESRSSIHCSSDMHSTGEVLVTRCSGKGSKNSFFKL
jgi:predicted dehydrogenase